MEPHSTSLYAPSGKGIIYVAEWTGTTPPTYPGSPASDYPTESDIAASLGDFVDIGNAPSLEVEPVLERRPHYSSRSGLRLKDLDPIVSTDYNLTFDLDELSAQNMKRFFMGSLAASTRIVSGMQSADKEYAMIFVSNNPIGPDQIFYFRRLSIGPAGPLQLIGDDYLVISFSGSGLSDDANHASSPYFDIKNITTTTTSTTTTTTA